MSQSLTIREATPSDSAWVLPLMNSHNRYFWNGNAIWYRFWHREDTAREYWIVVDPGLGCAHFRIRHDGCRVLDEIVTAPEARRKGIGRAMIDYIGRPIRLKTDVDNEVSNAFYLSLGFNLVGVVFSKSGKAMNEYVLCAE